MQFDSFTEQDYLERGFLLVRDLNEIASLACHKTREFRIDEYVPIDRIDGKSLVSMDPNRERRIREHTKRIQRELQRRKSSKV
jgi:hypothetical protein